MGSLGKMIVFLRPYWKMALIGPLLMFVEVGMDLIQPRLMQRIIDVGIAELDLSVIVSTGVIMVVLALVGVIGGGGSAIFSVRVSQGFGADLRSRLFRKIQSLSFANLDKLKTGELVTRLTNDVTQVQEVVLIAMRIMIRAPLMLFGSLIMAIVTSPRLSLLFVVLIPFLAVVFVLVIKRAHPFFSEVQKRLDGVNTVMQENLAGVRVVKAFVRGDHEQERFGTANDQLMDRTIIAMRLMAIVMPFMMLTLNIGIVAVVWFGGIQVSTGNITVGQIMAFVNYLLLTLFGLMIVSMVLTRLSRASASAERILEVLNSQPEVVDRADAIGDFSPRGRVVFENVTFDYDGENQDPVLTDVSFVAEAGETVAILGATGSGKSSLINLIPRFYDVDSGRITIDGVDVRDLAQEELRHNIGVALQESILFSGTIRENICYGRPDATDEEVMAAAVAAQAHEFISKLPDGYDSMIGQRGVNLSGGQKQRIAITRALIAKPAILIFDDSTSSVDVETEAKIREELAKLMETTTNFIIAQRISTVLAADKILVVDDGAIAAEGTHDELIVSSPIYREIYESQLGNGVKVNG